jgi:lysozyme
MQLSAAGLELVKRSEGFREQVYKDIAGLLTIGYGHKLLTHESFPNGINDAQAVALLARDLHGAELYVTHLVKVPLTQGQFDALVDFCFNMGAARLASSTLLTVLNHGRYQDAAEQLLRWDIAGGEVSQGLKTRREAELQLWHNSEVAQQTAA